MGFRGKKIQDRGWDAIEERDLTGITSRDRVHLDWVSEFVFSGKMNGGWGLDHTEVSMIL